MSWLYSIIVLIAIPVAGMAMYNAQSLSEANSKGELMAMSGSLMAYREHVVAYAKANPSMAGIAADSAMGLPTWFHRHADLANYVEAGKGYVYSTAVMPGLAYQVLKDSNNSIFVGIKAGGLVVNPLTGAGTVTAPAAIPDGVTIYAN